MANVDLASYLVSGRTTVPGWFYPADAHLFAVAASLASGPGDLVEVGAFLGASAIELGFLRRADERVVVIDPFEDVPDDRWAPDAGLSVDAFLANWRRFHAADPTLLVGRSDERLPEIATGTARFVHIDGSHYYDDVRADIAEALRIAQPDAVLVFDDVGPWQWAGVAAAVWKAVTDGELVPLAITTAKLYTTPAGSSLSADTLVAAARSEGMRMEGPHPVVGWPVWEAYAPPAPPAARARELAAGLVPPTLRSAGGTVARRVSRVVREQRLRRGR